MVVPKWFVIVYQYSNYLGSHKFCFYAMDYHLSLLPSILRSSPWLCDRLCEARNSLIQPLKVVVYQFPRYSCLHSSVVSSVILLCCLQHVFPYPAIILCLQLQSDIHMLGCGPALSLVSLNPPSSLAYFTEHSQDFSLCLLVMTASSLSLSLSRLQIDFGHRPVTELKTKDASYISVPIYTYI